MYLENHANVLSLVKEEYEVNEIIEKGLEAILPVYIKDIGNCTRIYTKDDEIILEKTIRSVLANLCKFYHLDLKASRKTYGDLLSIKKNTPIPFGYDLILIPIKTRKPIAKHDGAYGYVNMESIKSYTKSKTDNNTLIYISNNNVIEAYCKLSTINKNVNNGKIIKGLLRKNSLIRESNNLYIAEDSLATKKDIAMVYREIMEIKMGLK